MNPDHELILLRRLTVYLVLDCFGSQVSFSEAMWVSLTLPSFLPSEKAFGSRGAC